MHTPQPDEALLLPRRANSEIPLFESRSAIFKIGMKLLHYHKVVETEIALRRLKSKLKSRNSSIKKDMFCLKAWKVQDLKEYPGAAGNGDPETGALGSRL